MGFGERDHRLGGIERQAADAPPRQRQQQVGTCCQQAGRQRRPEFVDTVEIARISQRFGKRIELIGKKGLVMAAHRMADRQRRIARRGKMAAGAPVQFGRARRVAVLHPAQDHFTKQRMAPVAAALGIGGFDEQPLLFGALEHLAGTFKAGGRRTGRWRQLVEDRRIDEEIARLARLQRHDLFVEIGFELAPQAARPRRPGARAAPFTVPDGAGHDDARDPALGIFDKLLEQRRIDRPPAVAGDKGGGFGKGQPEILGTDFDQMAQRPQPRDRDGRTAARTDDRRQRIAGAGDDARYQRLHVGRQFLGVVDDQHRARAGLDPKARRAVH